MLSLDDFLRRFDLTWIYRFPCITTQYYCSIIIRYIVV